MRHFLLVAILLLSSACWCPTDLEEIYYVEIAEIEASNPSRIEITFTRDLSECVNGVAHRGFAYQTIQVEDPQLNGIALQPEQVESKYIRYVPKYEPRFLDYEVTFSIDGIRYETDYKRAEILKGRLRIYTKPRSAR